MLLHVAVSLVVACSINVIMTLAQTILKHLFGLNTFRDTFLKLIRYSKIRYPSGHIHMDKTGIVSDV
jgi:hypothetical protein